MAVDGLSGFTIPRPNADKGDLPYDVGILDGPVRMIGLDENLGGADLTATAFLGAGVAFLGDLTAFNVLAGNFLASFAFTGFFTLALFLTGLPRVGDLEETLFFLTAFFSDLVFFAAIFSILPFSEKVATPSLSLLKNGV